MKKIASALLLSILVASFAVLGGCACCGDEPKCHQEYGGKCH